MPPFWQGFAAVANISIRPTVGQFVV